MVTSCTNAQITNNSHADNSKSTNIPSIPYTPSPEATLTPTPTPVPVSLLQAVKEGHFGIIKEFDKGLITESLFSPDGTVFAAVTMSGLYIYNVNNWEEKNFISDGEDSDISSIVFSKDGKLFAYGDYDGVITICDAVSFSDCKTIKAYKDVVFNISFSPDGQNIVSVGRENETEYLRLWNVSDGSAIAGRQLNDWGIVSYSQDGSWIMADNTIWESKDLQFIKKMKNAGSYNLVSPFSNIVANVSHDLTIYNVVTEKNTTIENPFKEVGWEHDITFMDFVDVSHILVREENYNLLHLIDINTGAILDFSDDEISGLSIKNPNMMKITKEQEIIDLGFYPFRYDLDKKISKNGNYLLTEDGVFNTETWSIVHQESGYVTDWSQSFNLLNGDIARINGFGDSIENYKFMISIYDGEDLTSKTTKSVDYTLDEWYDQVALSPDGKLMAVGVRYGGLSLFDVDKNELILFKENVENYYKGFGPPETFSQIQFDDSSKVLRTTSFDGEATKYWHVPVLERINEANGDDNPFITNENYRKIVWTEDLVATRDLETLKIWSSDKSLLAEYPLVKGDALEVNPDGTLLYTCSMNGVFTIWGYKP